jgi:lipopolysaccharide transport system ATP-binding protein
MKPVIQIENISKQYRIGLQRKASYRTLRETIRDSLARPIAWLRKAARLRAVGATPEAGSQWFWALKDVSFEVEPGEVVGIIGRNGAGKSTLLKVLSRITEPTTGLVRLRGRVGSLLEVGTGFHPELTGRENIYLNGVILGMSRREVARRFDEIVAFAEMEQFLDTPVKRYSSGMYVRLAFAVAAHLDPEILIIDEVLAVGDMAFQKKCLGRMGDIAKSGRTILFVSHNMATVQNLCSRAVLLAGGRVAAQGDCAEVLASYLKPDASAEEAGSESLRSFRSQNALPVIQEIVITDEHGRRTGRFFAGDGMVVHIRYDSPVPLTQPVFGIFVRSITGERLFHLQTLAQHELIERLPTRGVVTCRVPSLPLVPGRYVLSFNCSTVYCPGNLDYLDGPAAIDIEATDYFGTGRLPPGRNGPFLVQADWEFPGSGEADLVRSNSPGSGLSEKDEWSP